MDACWYCIFFLIHFGHNFSANLVESIKSNHRLLSLLAGSQTSSTKYNSTFLKSAIAESHETIMKALNACNWGLVASVSLEEKEFLHTSSNILELFHSHNFPIIHYKTSNTIRGLGILENIIRDSYIQQSLTDFIILSSCPGCVLKVANEIFEKEKRGAGALMPNRLRFVIITLACVEGTLREMLRNSVFDNVALIIINKETLFISNVYTLMWRGSTKREFQKVSYTEKYAKPGHISTCKIFPNLKFGLNGRTLVILAKEWVTYLYKSPDQITGKMSYSGFSPAVIDILSQDLNFTYVYTPNAEIEDAYTWSDYISLIQNRTVDFGAALYQSNIMSFYNATITYPVITADIRGVYKHLKDYRELSDLEVIFKSDLYWRLILCLVATVAFYMFITKCFSGISFTSENIGRNKNNGYQTSQHIFENRHKRPKFEYFRKFKSGYKNMSKFVKRSKRHEINVDLTNHKQQPSTKNFSRKGNMGIGFVNSDGRSFCDNMVDMCDVETAKTTAGRLCCENMVDMCDVETAKTTTGRLCCENMVDMCDVETAKTTTGRLCCENMVDIRDLKPPKTKTRRMPHSTKKKQNVKIGNSYKVHHGNDINNTCNRGITLLGNSTQGNYAHGSGVQDKCVQGKYLQDNYVHSCKPPIDKKGYAAKTYSSFVVRNVVGVNNYNINDDIQQTETATPSYSNKTSNEDKSTPEINMRIANYGEKEHLLDVFFAFLGSFYGQSALPFPPLLSARILVCSWCLTLISITTIINGTLTANFIDNNSDIPFKTFDSLQAQKEYKWGVYNESTILKVFEFSKPGTTLRNLYDGVENFAKTDSKVFGTFEDIQHKLLSEKFVAIMDSFTYKYLVHTKNLSTLTVMPDILMTVQLGYMFPKDSELASLFSSHIMKLVEFGTIEDIFRKSYINSIRRDHESHENEEIPININSIRLLLKICMYSAVVSVFVLLLECIVGTTNTISIVKKRVIRLCPAIFKAVFNE